MASWGHWRLLGKRLPGKRLPGKWLTGKRFPGSTCLFLIALADLFSAIALLLRQHSLQRRVRIRLHNLHAFFSDLKESHCTNRNVLANGLYSTLIKLMKTLQYWEMNPPLFKSLFSSHTHFRIWPICIYPSHQNRAVLSRMLLNIMSLSVEGQQVPAFPMMPKQRVRKRRGTLPPHLADSRVFLCRRSHLAVEENQFRRSQSCGRFCFSYSLKIRFCNSLCRRFCNSLGDLVERFSVRDEMVQVSE